MARTILEDYYSETSSHFELAYRIPRRARDIQRKGNALVAERDDKPIVIALREISERQSRFDARAEQAAEAAHAAEDIRAAQEAYDAQVARAAARAARDAPAE